MVCYGKFCQKACKITMYVHGYTTFGNILIKEKVMGLGITVEERVFL